MEREKGIIIIFIFGTLSLIILIVFIFLSVVKAEKGISEFNIIKAKTYFTAFSGIEFTQVSLLEAFNQNTSNTYLSNNKNIPVKYIIHDDVEFFYTVKTTDENTKININLGCGKPIDYPSNKMLSRMLNILGKQLNIEALDTKILTNRKDKCYTLLEELRGVLGNNFNRLKNYLTVTSFTYKNRLVPQATIVDIKENLPVYTLNSLYIPNDKYLTEERFPININLAPLEVLVAVLEGLYSFYIDRNLPKDLYKFYPYSQPGVPFIPEEIPIGITKYSTPISYETAITISQQIIKKREVKPFSNWEDFSKFLNELVKNKIIDEIQKEVIEVNFNPNSHLILYNPNSLIGRNIDKTFLINYSVEFTFEPMGYFTIESRGKAVYKGRKIGETYITRYVKLWDALYYDTQEDFVGGDNKSYTLPNGLASYPANINAYYSPHKIEGYIALADISREWEKEYTNISMRASFINSLVADFAIGEKYVIPDIEGYPRLLPDGAYSERYKILRFPIKGRFKSKEESKEQSNTLSLYNQTIAIFKSIPIDCSKEVYLYDLFDSSTDAEKRVKKLDRAKFVEFIKKQEFGSIYGKGINKLVGHLFNEEDKETVKDMFQVLSLTPSAITISKSEDPEKHKKAVEILRNSIENAKCIAFVPHTCCFWDILWGEHNSKSQKDYHNLPYDYDIHYYVGINQIKMLKMVDEEYFNNLMVACGAKKGEVPPLPAKLLQGQAYMCEKTSSPPIPDGDNYGIISFWIKPNWGYASNYARNKGQLILSMTRRSKDILQKLGKYALSSTCLPLLDDDLFLLGNNGERLLNVWKSVGIQDFYLAYSPPLPAISSKGLKFVIDAGLGHERENYNHKASFYEVHIDSGKWYNISLVWDGNRQTTTPYEIFLNNTALEGSSIKQEATDEQWSDNESIANNENDGIRFGEVPQRLYNANERSVYNPWAWGMNSPDATFDEIITFKEIPENYKEIIRNLYEAGRYNNSPKNTYIKNINLTNISLLKITATFYTPDYLSYNIIFNIYADKVSKAITVFPEQEIIDNTTIKNLWQFGIEFSKKDRATTLLETPILDDIHIFYHKETTVIKEYIDFGIDNE